MSNGVEGNKEQTCEGQMQNGNYYCFPFINEMKWNAILPFRPLVSFITFVRCPPLQMCFSLALHLRRNRVWLHSPIVYVCNYTSVPCRVLLKMCDPSGGGTICAQHDYCWQRNNLKTYKIHKCTIYGTWHIAVVVEI